MKKIILSVLSFALLLSTTTIAYAAYNYVSPSVGSVGYNYAQMLTQQTGYRILDVDPHGYISYIVTISYDDLSSVCTAANGIGLSCSLYYNAYMNLYVIDVDDKALFGLTSTYGAIGNVDGNVLVAEKPDQALVDLLDNGKIWNNYGIGQWGIYADYSSSSVLREVSYATLSELCASLNEKGIPCYISSTSAWGSSTYWYIRGSGTITYRPRYDAPSTSYSITDHVYLDIAAAPLVARYNPESTLSSCLSRLTSIQTNVTTIKNNIVNTISSNLESLLTTCNTISTKLDTLTSVISNGKVLVDNSDVVSAIQSIPAYDDSTLVSAVTTISNQITEQFGEYESTYSFPSFYSQSTSSNKTISGVSSSAFSSINPGSRKLLYSPSSALTLSKDLVYSGGGICQAVYCSPYISQTYGLGYQLNFTFRFSYTQNTSRSETVQFPKFSFTDFSGKTLTKNPYTGSVRVPPRSNYAYASSYYFPRWDASGNWLGWSGQNDTFQWTSSTYEPSKRVYLTPPESGTYYIYGTSDTAIPVVYASRFTGFLQSQTDRVVNAVGSIPAPTDYTAQLTAVTGRMDDILAQLQSTSGSATCEHTYSQHMEQEATCILPGLMISTCSKCGDSSSEIVDPLGHDWQCTSHVDAVTDPDTGEETSSAYDIYTCSRCGDTYEDHTGTGAPDEDYSNTTISQLVVKVFSKLGTFAGKLLGSVVHLFDKAVNAVDDLASKFNDYVEQIKGFGENYPLWLSGFWGIIPAELQVALTFAVICMALGVVGKKLFFS